MTSSNIFCPQPKGFIISEISTKHFITSQNRVLDIKKCHCRYQFLNKSVFTVCPPWPSSSSRTSSWWGSWLCTPPTKRRTSSWWLCRRIQLGWIQTTSGSSPPPSKGQSLYPACTLTESAPPQTSLILVVSCVSQVRWPVHPESFLRRREVKGLERSRVHQVGVGVLRRERDSVHGPVWEVGF